MQRSISAANSSTAELSSRHHHWLDEFRWLLVAALATALVFVGAGQAWGQGNSGHRFAKGQILVAKKKTSSRPEFDAAVASHGVRAQATIAGIDVDVVKVPPGRELEFVARLAGNPHVDFAEVDAELDLAATVNDPSVGNEWHLPRINASQAWDSTLGGGVTIAILDTGVDGTHPDLAARMVPGWNFYSNNSDTSDFMGHGTAVAGAAAAAANNAIGVAGVAGGASIMPLRVTDANGGVSGSTAASAIIWAADHGARVVNMSFTGTTATSTIVSAVQYLRSKGGVAFAAAGNSGAVDNSAPSSVIQVVSATDENDAIASFSTYGSFVTISAPGNNIFTTARGGGYWYCWGTSLATPVVSGAAALVIARRPDFTPAQVDATLKASATDLGSAGNDIYYGAGRVNAGAAVTLAANTSATDTTPPTVAIASPTGGSVAGTVAVNVSANDNVAVTRVDLRVNGTTVVTDTSAPWVLSWNTASRANGTVTLTAVAYDAAGNSATSASVTVNVANGDSTPPSVAITSPSTGATVSGVATVAANATDNVGVTRVDFRLNGTVVASTNTAPYQYAWTTTQYGAGAYTLSAVAVDAAGNSATSATVNVNVANPVSGDTTAPRATIASPLGGNVDGVVPVTVNATDNVGVTRVDLKVNGIVVASSSAVPYTFSWDTSSHANGAAALTAVAYDAAGNVGNSSSVSVNVAHTIAGGGDTTPPTVTLKNPANGAMVSGMITVSAAATDNSGNTGLKLTLYIDGVAKASTTGATISYNWNTKKIAPGSHVVMVTALDAAGNAASAQASVTRK